MLTAFYVIVAVCAAFVCLSLAVVRAHERHVKEKAESTEQRDTPLEAQEEEFFSSPIYKAMEAVAHL